jgi:hypothetical protein
VVGRSGWGSPAPRPWLEGPLSNVGAAGGDRARPRARGQSVRSIAAAIGRSPSTVSRDLRRNARSAACACVASNHYSFAATSSGRLPLVEVADVEPRASKLRRECGPRRSHPSPPTCPETRTPWGLTG